MSRISQVAGLELNESSYDYQQSLHQTGPSDFQEFSSMQACSFGALPTIYIMEASATRRVNVFQSSLLYSFNCHHPLGLTIVNGAETDMMKASLAMHIGSIMTKSSQNALQNDGPTLLTVVGETCLPLIHHGKYLTLEALVVQDFDVDILA